MIPRFPRFKKLSLEDKDEIEAVIKGFPPYSDYNFVSLLSWNTNERIEVAKLYENLVIKFEDYVTNEIFYSFLGVRYVDKTLNTLLARAKNEGVSPTLRLIPETVVKKIAQPQNFKVTK